MSLFAHYKYQFPVWDRYNPRNYITEGKLMNRPCSSINTFQTFNFLLPNVRKLNTNSILEVLGNDFVNYALEM